MPFHEKYIFELLLGEASHVRASLASGDFRTIIFIISFAAASDADDDRFDEEVRVSGARHDTTRSKPTRRFLNPFHLHFTAQSPNPIRIAEGEKPVSTSGGRMFSEIYKSSFR